MDALVAEGVTSFKLFMAYPRRPHARRRLDLPRAPAHGARTAARSACTPRTATSSTCSSKRALAEGKTAPKYHALTRPPRAEAEATHRAIALAEMAGVPLYIVHLSAAEALEKVTEARDRGLPALRRDLPAVPLPLLRQLRGARLRGREVRDVARRCAPKGNEEELWRGLARATTCRPSRPTTARSA